MAATTVDDIAAAIKRQVPHQNQAILLDFEGLIPVQEALLAPQDGVRNSKWRVESIIRILGQWLLSRLLRIPYLPEGTPLILDYCQSSLQRLETVEEASITETGSSIRTSVGSSSVQVQRNPRLSAESSSRDGLAKRVVA